MTNKNANKKRRQNVQLTDRLLLVNLYLTQGLTLIAGVVWILLQGRNPLDLLAFPHDVRFLYWGIGLAVAMFFIDFLMTIYGRDEDMDDGGINALLFRSRPLWHIFVIAALVSICEELLFRGAVQFHLGPYWTSILFAAIHIRYLRHWLPTAWVFASSYGLGWIYVQSGTLWAPIVCHFLIDFISGIMIKRREQ
ncbi:type II CAAX endopeptidase family protein [Saccharibacillus sp. CPCC 101409]|uniref:CPBP family intramembrane glutamic endopeptidase n=1 Tax=Saccharibacillus sp. CPCC 101409 TaxID=3058041 RepID=UPI002673BA92|nr:type II CAAX endopeptidase family protein [Saccharibacillus sp. CPCC 101409]MDO3409586.1 type II CAAX endopeptidase family protein [Saccharibacillus sp. CPCC 101409]